MAASHLLQSPPAFPFVVILLAVLTFLPVNFVHPVRVVRWRGATLAVTAVWFVCGAWLLITNFRAPLAVALALVAASAYLIGVSAAQQYLRSREAYSTRT